MFIKSVYWLSSLKHNNLILEESYLWNLTRFFMASGCETILVIIGTFDLNCYLHEIITIR